MKNNSLVVPKSDFAFVCELRHLIKFKLLDSFKLDVSKLNKDSSLSFKCSIVPNHYISMSIFAKGSLIHESSHSLLEIESVEFVKSLGALMASSRSHELLYDLLNEAFLLFSDSETIDEDFLAFIDDYSYSKEFLKFYCFPNMLKTKFVFNFLDIVKTNEQLEVICSDDSSALDIAKVFFPLISKNSANAIASIFSFNSEENSNYSSNMFRSNLLSVFENQDKFAFFFNNIVELYKAEFDHLHFIELQGFDWSDVPLHFGLKNSIEKFLPQTKNSFEDFLIRSIEPLFHEVRDGYSELGMGDNCYDGQLDIFESIENYLVDYMKTIQSINEFIDSIPPKHENKDSVLKLYENFISKYRANDLLSLHDDFASLLVDLNNELNGRIEFGDKEKLENAIPYEYSKDVLNFFNDSLNGFDFKLAESNNDLVFLGDTMRHCVAGYHSAILNNPNHLILAIFDNGNPLLCIEILDNCLIQAKKKGNRRLNRSLSTDRNMISALRSYINERGLSVDTSDLVAIKN